MSSQSPLPALYALTAKYLCRYCSGNNLDLLDGMFTRTRY
jgi:hypothetical protein